MEDRLIMHTVHTDDGATELYFGRAKNDFGDPLDGSILFHKDGSFTYKLWTENEDPVVVTVKGNHVVVRITEDQESMDEGAAQYPDVIFDTDLLSFSKHDNATRYLGSSVIHHGN